MGSFGRARGARVSVTPGVVRPRQTVTATVTTDGPVDEVATATLEWGYDNVSRQADTADWVCVTRAELPVAASRFTGGAATFAVPSWAPGSSQAIARWSARLRIQRGGQPVDERGEFTVVIGAADVDAVVEPLERLSGDRTAGVDVTLGSPLYVAGQTITGLVVLDPAADLPGTGVAVHWQRDREFHPLTGAPEETERLDGPVVPLTGEGTLPFALALPDDAAPTAAAVHSSLSWYVAARVVHADRVHVVRRPITVVNAL